MDAAQPHGVVGRLEVEDGEVRDDHADFVKARRARPRRSRTVVTDTRDTVDAFDEDARRVLRHPVARRVVHRVAGGTAHAEQLRLRPFPRTDAGDVLVPEPVDLRGTHHHVPLSRPGNREEMAEREPSLDQLRGIRRGADGKGRAQQLRVAVGVQEVGLERHRREPHRDRRDRPDRAGEQLAVAAPCLRARDDAHFCSRRTLARAHRPTATRR